GRKVQSAKCKVQSAKYKVTTLFLETPVVDQALAKAKPSNPIVYIVSSPTSNFNSHNPTTTTTVPGIYSTLLYSSSTLYSVAMSSTYKKSSCSRFVIVHGIRYVRPYLHDQVYSVRMHHADKQTPIAEVLADAFGRTSNSFEESLHYFQQEVKHGRVQWKRNKRSREDDEPLFETVLDPDLPTRRNDILKIQRHVHERCIVGAPLITVPCRAGADIHNYTTCNNEEDDCYRAIFKPAGIPVVGNEGTCYGSVTGILQDSGEGDYRLGHRIDLPVSGILLLGKGPRRGKRIIQALSPSMKQTTEGFVKAYLARVKGGKDIVAKEEGKIEVKCKLQWDNRQKKALVVDDNHVHYKGEDKSNKDDGKGKKARDTITYVQGLKYDPNTNTSLVRVELVTGARQQVRAVLASLGIPIIGDTIYGGGDFPQKEEYVLFRDDLQHSLLNMLQEEQKEWCDKCRWQMEEVKHGGTERGTEQLGQQICLLSYHYRIPSLGIDARVPNDLMPEWAM
ncbi:MAG: hypothetical protein SGILL_001007, partial [Bacillariaceae sp.]